MNHSKTILALLCIAASIGLMTGCANQSPTGSAPAGTSSSAESAASGSAVSSSPSAQPEAGEKPEEVLPDALPLDFVFSSGAGGWGTKLTLNADGSFQGQYSDSEMGEQGNGYPHGTVYTSTFSGQFSEIKKMNGNSFSLTLSTLNTEGTLNEEKIEDEIRYVTAEPYGLESGTDFILYTPDTPTADLSEDFLSWWPLRFSADGSTPSTLSCYGLLNVDNGYGFFSGE